MKTSIWVLYLFLSYQQPAEILVYPSEEICMKAAAEKKKALYAKAKRQPLAICAEYQRVGALI